MPVFVVTRHTDKRTEPFLVLEAKSTQHAIDKAKVLEDTGKLILLGYFGTLDKFTAKLASADQIADFTAKGTAVPKDTPSDPDWGPLHFLVPRDM